MPKTSEMVEVETAEERATFLADQSVGKTPRELRDIAAIEIREAERAAVERVARWVRCYWSEWWAMRIRDHTDDILSPGEKA